MNDVFNSSYFNYTENYRIYNYFFLNLKKKYEEKYALLINSLISKDDIYIIPTAPNRPIPISNISMRDLFFGKLLDKMKLIINTLYCCELRYRKKRNRVDEIDLFILIQIIDPKKFSEDILAYIQNKKKNIHIDVTFIIDIVKVCLGRLVSCDVVNEDESINPPP